MQHTLSCARQDRGVLGQHERAVGPLPCPAPASSKAQVRTSTTSTLFLPFLLSSWNSGKSEDNVNTFLLCTSTSCLHGSGCRRSSWSSPHHASLAAGGYGTSLLPPHHPHCTATPAGDVTRARCTLAISGACRSRHRKKNLKPLLHNKLLQCGDTELNSSIFFLTLAMKCKTHSVVFNYAFTTYFSNGITTLPYLHTHVSASAPVVFTLSDTET